MAYKRRDKRTDAEKRFDEQLEVVLEKSMPLEDLLTILSVMERKTELRNKRRISPDTLVVVAGNLLGILVIMEHERAHVIATKALSFVIRGRV